VNSVTHDVDDKSMEPSEQRHVALTLSLYSRTNSGV
jgi:hypothetical protein